MRKRPNINGIQSIYEIPKSCDHCKMNFSPGNDIVVELDKQISYCFTCGGDDTIEPQIGKWIHHVYSIKSDINTFYNVEEISKFENFIGETVIKE